MLGADAERRELERRLHDGVQQDLVALAVKLQLAGRLIDSDPGSARALVDDATAEVEQALAAAARLAEQMFPALLDESGLAAALRAAIVNGGFSATVESATIEGCPPGVARTVFWVCLDLLEHADRTERVRISIRERAGALAVDVVGLLSAVEPDESFERLRDRVEALAGELTIESSPDRRFSARGWLPLSR
ncbi:MAG TPA: histidine kinase [Gaiellaceae bacterium]|nr:histidine kinase [Gaiellaceae bacterium]